ncbi:MAG: hypothetical protein PHH37_12165 [Paludibacter sp.]|nr:hypothetical protein [Paludibacter sp.]
MGNRFLKINKQLFPTAKGAFLIALILMGFTIYAMQQAPQNTEIKVVSNDLQKGKEIYENKCGKCHKLFEPEKYKAKQWTKWVDKMAPKAKLNVEQKKLVYKYLTNDKK